MKTFILVFLLFVAGATASASELTNGVFYVDNPVDCQLIQQNGVTTTNTIVSGKTVTVGNSLMEITTGPKTLFYFAGGPLVEVSAKSSISVNLFDREVKNLKSMPRKAEFGTCNLSLMFNIGEYCVIYPNTDSNSSLTITTPYTSYEIQNGKFYFRVTDRSAIVYVLEGMMNVHGDKKVDKTAKGNLAIAVPFVDPASGLNDKVVTSIKPVKQEETDKFTAPVILAEKKWADVQFFVLEGKVVGIWMK